MDAQKKQKIIEYAVVAASALAFLIYKLNNLVYRHSDHNIYFFYGDKILHGHVPFRDFFMTDPGLYAYILAGVKFLVGKDILLLQAIPLLLHVIIAILIFALLKKWQTKLALLAPAIYLFSFSTLANSDYATGEEWAILTMLLALLLWENKKPFWSGVLWALTGLLKLYTGAALIGFLIYNFFTAGKKNTLKLIAGGIPLALLWFGAFTLIARNNFWYSLIGFHLHRPAGLDKGAIYLYFLQHEMLLLGLGILGLIILRKKAVWAMAAGLAIFFLAFKDLYYLYLQTLIPLLTLGTIAFLSWLWQTKNGKAYALSVIALYAGMTVYSISFYNQNWLPRAQFTNAAEVSKEVAALPENYPLYGTYETTPLVSLLSGRDIFKNYYDTNPISFWNGRLDKTKISNEAVDNGVYLVSRISYYPQYGIDQTGFEEYFDKSLFTKYCKPALVFASTSNENDNYLAIYKCKK